VDLLRGSRQLAIDLLQRNGCNGYENSSVITSKYSAHLLWLAVSGYEVYERPSYL